MTSELERKLDKIKDGVDSISFNFYNIATQICEIEEKQRKNGKIVNAIVKGDASFVREYSSRNVG